ncbi:MAG: hypothetical protein A2W25_10775 [candidate division Zixibacteria bacterium RBG_16_53_22]|nr:MAG: hypothetical protein A2W25_10775 [candidate division Zixibacteria bacterium RBG_16_53_22]
MSHPVKISSLHIYDDPQDVEVEGQYAYIANENQRVTIVDISNPYNPQVLTSIDSLCHAKEIFIDSLAYVAYCWSGVRVLDITDPANPAYLSTFNTVGWAWDIYERDGILHVADNSGGFCTIDARDPHHPVLLDSLRSLHGTISVCVDGDYAYLIDAWAGLVILNVSDPANIFRVCTRYISQARDIQVFENYAIISRGTGRLRVYDISDPLSPVPVDSVNTWGSANELCIRNGYIYVADEIYFEILRFIPTGIQDYDTRPRASALPLNYPNPFNVSTTILYALPSESEVIIEFFDITGRIVDAATIGRLKAGEQSHIWNAAGLSSGIYFYRIKADEFSETGKCLLLR